MKWAITVPGELEGGTTIVRSRWPRCVNVVVAGRALPAGVVAPAVPGASVVVNGLAANGLLAVVAAAAREPPSAVDPILWIASELIEIPGIGVGGDTTGVVGELGGVATGGAVIGVVTPGALGAGVGTVGVGVTVGGVTVGVGVTVGATVGATDGVELEDELGGRSPGESFPWSFPWCFSWPGGMPP